MPKVSVIVPNYNHAPFLKERIESVLDQTFRDLELIILDDCSTDNSREIIESYRSESRVSHIILNERNSGSPFAQWKRGIGLAKGEYIWIAESDDSADPTFLEKLTDLLDGDKDMRMAFSGSVMIDSEGNPISGMDWDRWKKDDALVERMSGRELARRKLLWTSDVYNASMVLFRKEGAPEIKERQLGMHYCGDWWFWVSMAMKGDAVILREKLNRFRQHDLKVSPGASKSGLYFIEGLPVMVRVADFLELNGSQRKMLAGRTWKRLGKFPDLLEKRGDEILANLNKLCPGASGKRNSLVLFYEIDKYLNFTGLQPK